MRMERGHTHTKKCPTMRHCTYRRSAWSTQNPRGTCRSTDLSARADFAHPFKDGEERFAARWRRHQGRERAQRTTVDERWLRENAVVSDRAAV